ncbi:MAG: hypothetical protein WBE51_06445 [Xanthobacteraceae bacterium]
MPDGIPTHPEVLLVGSVGLHSAEDVFRTVSATLGDRVKRIPDGETGPRSLWVFWPRRVLERNPAFEIDPEEGARGMRATSEVEGVRRWIGNEAAKQGEPPPPRMRLRAGVDPREIELGPLGYAEVAAESYAVFRQLRDDGVIPPGLKFQVSLPTTAAFLNAHVVYSQHAVIEPVYRAKLLDEVRQMAKTVPRSDLAIQWDVSTEMGQWEGVRHAYFGDVQKGVVDRLTIHCDAVPGDVEMGIHLCYGDYGHRHWMEPATTANMVAVYNALSERVTRPINWLHMPVPRSRDDDAYYAPLRELRLKPETKLYLGLIHLSDGVEGTRGRMSTAAKFASDFGVATECGFGGRPPNTISDLLAIHAAL